MICPYCAEDVPVNSKRHSGCKGNEKRKDGNFPEEYLKFHGRKGDLEPVILSIVGFKGHGKTVYLCSLFDFFDHVLTRAWPRFFNDVSLDEDSLSTLKENRRNLRQGTLPLPTKDDFPRPGIFRLTNMPHMEDSSILIYDPPGEAFESGSAAMIKYASFVKRSSCVLFLIDMVELRTRDKKAVITTVADEMATLLDTFVLGMRHMGMKEKSQHLIVVYTKSDELKSSFPLFQSYLEEHVDLKAYLNERMPATLAAPIDHLNRLGKMSRLLEDFTLSKLEAWRFNSVAQSYFKDITYTAVSALGSSPEVDEKGNKTMKVEMSPRCVADPLLYVLATHSETQTKSRQWPGWLKLACLLGFIGIGLVALMFFFWLQSNSQSEGSVPSNDFPGPRSTASSLPRASVGPPGAPVSLPNTPVSLPVTAGLLTAPTDDAAVILSMPRNTMVSLLGVTTDSNGKAWVKVRVKDQDCQVGSAHWDSCDGNRVLISQYVGWVCEQDRAGNVIVDFPADLSGPGTLIRNANLRSNAGEDEGIPVLILCRGNNVTLIEEEPQYMEDASVWRKVEVKNQLCGVSPPTDTSNEGNVFTVHVARAEGWIDRNLLNL